MKDNSITYRLATQADSYHLAQMRVEFLTELMGPQSDEKKAALYHSLIEYFDMELISGGYVSWLAFDEQKLVANGGMKITQRPGSFKVPNGRSGYIMNMYTKPDYRKMGIGKTILLNLISTGKTLGLIFFELHATSDGEPLYKQNGFHLHPEPTYRLFI